MYPSIQDHIMFHDPPTNPLCPSYSSLLSQEAPTCFPRRHPPASARDARDTSLIPGSWRSPGGDHDNPPQYFCLENTMDKRTWWTTVHRVEKSQTQLSEWKCSTFIISFPEAEKCFKYMLLEKTQRSWIIVMLWCASELSIKIKKNTYPQAHIWSFWFCESRVKLRNLLFSQIPHGILMQFIWNQTLRNIAPGFDD